MSAGNPLADQNSLAQEQSEFYNSLSQQANMSYTVGQQGLYTNVANTTVSYTNVAGTTVQPDVSDPAAYDANAISLQIFERLRAKDPAFAETIKDLDQCHALAMFFKTYLTSHNYPLRYNYIEEAWSAFKDQLARIEQAKLKGEQETMQQILNAPEDTSIFAWIERIGERE